VTTPTILIIDDEPEMCWALEKAMQMEGFATVTAGGGNEGLDKFSAQKITAVLVDLKMPDMDGLEVIRRIRQADASIPVILITGHGNMDVAYEALSEDATGYVIKPFSMADLRATVRRLVCEAQDMEGF